MFTLTTGYQAAKWTDALFAPNVTLDWYYIQHVTQRPLASEEHVGWTIT